MDTMRLLDSDLFRWVLLPLLIFLARVADVSIGTIRLIFLGRGHKFIAPVLGFFEVLIWLLAIQQVLHNLSNAFCYLGYAGGFAFGNYVGILLDEKLAFGKCVLRIITSKDASSLVQALRRKGFGVTHIPAEGQSGPVSLLFTVIDRSDVDRAISVVEKYTPKAFFTLEPIQQVREGIFPRRHGTVLRRFKVFRFYRIARLFGRNLFRRTGK